MAQPTVILNRRGEVPRRDNYSTMTWQMPRAPIDAAHVAEHQAAFTSALHTFGEHTRGIEGEGLAYGLISREGKLETSAVQALVRDRGLTAVLGRHSHADSMSLDQHFGLRHALLFYSEHDLDAVTLFDLRSETGIDGRRSDGPWRLPLPGALFLGPYMFVAWRTTQPTPNAEDWLALGQKLEPILHDAPALPLSVDMRGYGAVSESSEGASAPRIAWQDTLLPPEALSRGVLIGRSGRCDLPVSGELWPASLSRVHALIFARFGASYIADTGSKNGLYHKGFGHIRCKRLESGDELLMGAHVSLRVG